MASKNGVDEVLKESTNLVKELEEGWKKAEEAVTEYEKQNAISMMAVQAAVQTASIAMTMMREEIKLTTVVQQALNTVLNATPTQLLVAGIAVVVTAFGVFSLATEDSSQKADELSQKIISQREALDQLATTRDEKLSVDLAEINNVQDLWEELKNITDEYGNVNEGSEQRAAFLVEEINTLMPQSIEWLDKERATLKMNRDELDKLIEKKKIAGSSRCLST